MNFRPTEPQRERVWEHFSPLETAHPLFSLSGHARPHLPSPGGSSALSNFLFVKFKVCVACARLLIHKRLFSACSHSNHQWQWEEERGRGDLTEIQARGAQVDRPSFLFPTNQESTGSCTCHGDSGGHMFLTMTCSFLRLPVGCGHSLSLSLSASL